MNQSEDIRRHNETVAQRFAKIEAGMDAARTVEAVFETLFEGIAGEFSVPFVWLPLIDDEHTRPLIDAVWSCASLKERLCVLPTEAFSRIVPDASKPALANRDLQPYYRLLPKDQKYFVRSVAVVPFSFHDRIAGAWNNGDSAPERFSPDMETGLLAGLGRSLSRKLTQLMPVEQP